jgi:ABC-type sugar transport system ATPase subunit
MTLTASPVLEMRGITIDFPGVRALDAVSFDLRYGEIHAIVGENGAGKSTLIKILGGVYPHGTFTGEIMIRGRQARFQSIHDSSRAGIAVIHQELALVSSMTAAENLFLGDEILRRGLVDTHATISEAEALVSRLGLDIDVLCDVSEFGIAQQQLVEIAKALRHKSELVVFDEPTAALSERETEHLLALLRDLAAGGTSIIYISHRLEEVFSVANRVTVLRDGKFIETRSTSEWSRRSLIAAMVGRELHEMFPPLPGDRGEKLLEVRNLNVADPVIPGRKILDSISLTVHRREIVGLAGLMGAGRSEFLSTISGSPPGVVIAGEISLRGEEVSIRSPKDAIEDGIAFVPDDRKARGLILGMSVAENLTLVHLEQWCHGAMIDDAAAFEASEAVSRQLDIRTSSLNIPVEFLSGGNQQKVVLGKWLIKTPAVFLLDEPTRGIDVGAKVEIYQLINELKQNNVGLILASNELPELLGLCDRIVVFRRGKVSGTLMRAEANQERIMELAA